MLTTPSRLNQGKQEAFLEAWEHIEPLKCFYHSKDDFDGAEKKGSHTNLLVGRPTGGFHIHHTLLNKRNALLL